MPETAQLISSRPSAARALLPGTAMIAVTFGLSRYGYTVVGAPGDETWLRIVKETRGRGSFFTAYTSQDGQHWVRGGTWKHNQLGTELQIGLVSMGADSPMDDTARFDHVRVWALKR